MSEFNQKLCDERHQHLDKAKNLLFQKVEGLEKTINGNGRTGMAAKVDALWHWYQRQTATRAGLLDWVFRVAISIALGYIAVKVGLR